MSRGCLGLVLVLGTHIYVHVLEDGPSKAVLGEHAADGILDQALGRTLAHLLSRTAVLTTGVTGEADVLLVFPLVARQLHLFGIDHDDVVTTIGVRGEVHFVLAAEQASDFGTEATEPLPLGIDQQPFLVGVLLIDGDCLVAQRVHGGSS